ncbi:MAG: hypothetical protein H0V10_12405 [Geodermatophilaceae bacterium]|jgi:hypothetical protein|nr:hypothetical protein [Geodermatophilaceae bacterium]MDQ3106025.1 hypothetical protein [Actinomycetota bacterium]
MKTTAHERDTVLAYLAAQLGDDPVLHLEKVAVERVGAVVHDDWDAHCRDSRWWAVSNPLNLYSQEDFKRPSAVRVRVRHALPGSRARATRKWFCPSGQHQTVVPRQRVVSPGVVRTARKRLACLPEGWLQ